ncbi:MAG: YkvA family protein [Chloroflexota bacterium]
MFERLQALRRLPGYITLSWRLFQDPRVPTQSKVVAGGAIALILSPIDVLEWIPMVGPASDVVLIGLVLRTFINAAPEEVRLEHMAALGMRDI